VKNPSFAREGGLQLFAVIASPFGKDCCGLEPDGFIVLLPRRRAPKTGIGSHSALSPVLKTPRNPSNWD
jgi:hypothetical protein